MPHPNPPGRDQGGAPGGDLAGLNWRFLPIEAAGWTSTNFPDRQPPKPPKIAKLTNVW